MRIVFMGTPEFARKSLESLYDDGHDIAGVFTQPDKPRSRGLKPGFSQVKALALEHNTPVFQPTTLKDGSAAAIVRELQCDLICVVAYAKLLTPDILEIPKYGCINIHGSLLPKYRGAAPIQWAIINGETETGVTSMQVREKMDVGEILLVYKTSIGDDETAGELFTRLGQSGAILLSETVDAISRGALVRHPQNDREATHAPPLSRVMSPIDWNDTAIRIKCKVRGLNPWPSATAEIFGTLCKILKVDVTGRYTGYPPGEIVSVGKDGIEIACADGTVMIKELQAPGRKRMPAGDYLHGLRTL